MLFIIIGTLLGGLFGGLKGLIIGAALGWLAGRLVQRWLIGQLNVVQSQLLDSTFAVMGALCKTDGVVTREEIKAAERIFDMLQLGADQRRDARAAFNRGKQPDFDLDAAVDAFAATVGGSSGFSITGIVVPATSASRSVPSVSPVMNIMRRWSSGISGRSVWYSSGPPASGMRTSLMMMS